MLEVENISASYGAVRALEQTSLRIEQQEIVCLLGSNGAGKTTMLNCISGVLPLAGTPSKINTCGPRPLKLWDAPTLSAIRFSPCASDLSKRAPL